MLIIELFKSVMALLKIYSLSLLCLIYLMSSAYGIMFVCVFLCCFQSANSLMWFRGISTFITNSTTPSTHKGQHSDYLLPHNCTHPHKNMIYKHCQIINLMCIQSYYYTHKHMKQFLIIMYISIQVSLYEIYTIRVQVKCLYLFNAPDNSICI